MWPFMSVFISIMYSKFIHFVACSNALFPFIFLLWLKSILLYRYTTFSLSINTWWHLNRFHFFTIMKNAALNIHVQVFVWTSVFYSLVFIPKCAIAESYVTQYLTFEGTAKLFSETAVPCYISISNTRGL